MEAQDFEGTARQDVHTAGIPLAAALVVETHSTVSIAPTRNIAHVLPDPHISTPRVQNPASSVD